MIWVEVLNRRHEVVARHRFSTAMIGIGRGYGNEVVVDDPYVAADHLRVFRDADGCLVVEDLGSANGLCALPGERRVARVEIDGDRILRIGHTLLRIRESDFPVGPERILAPARREWHVAGALALAGLGTMSLAHWLATTGENRIGEFFLQALGASVAVLAWTALWALLSRLLTGTARFERHLSIALAALIATFALLVALDVSVFALSARLLGEYHYVPVWLLIAAICFLHLRELGPTHLRLKVAVPFCLALLVIAAQTVSESEGRANFGQRSYLRHLEPPMLRIVRPQEVGTFMAGAGRLKDALDEARREEPRDTDARAED